MATALALATSASAQLPDGSIAPNFTATDIDGNTWTLYDLLDDGYTVVMDISAAWCGPCWSYHNSGALENLYNTYGPGTSYDKVMVLFIEGESQNTGAQITGTSGSGALYSQGDWTVGTPYPIIDDATIADDYQISYFPTIYTICPNRVLHESGQINTASHWSDVQTCPEAATGLNASMLSYDGETIVCGNLNMPVTIQNMGTTTLSSATINVKQGATTLATYNWSGSLPTYNTASHTFTGVAVTNPAVVTVEVTTSGDAVAGDNSLDPGLIPAEDATQNLYFNLFLDWYCSETTWELKNSAGTVVEEGGPYNCSASNGGGADAFTWKNYDWNVPMGCYQLFLYDSYGDGLESTNYGQPQDGQWDLRDGGYNVLWSGTADFGDETKGGVNVNTVAGVAEVSGNRGVTIGPNPTDGDVTLTVNLAAAGMVSLRVYDVLGQVVLGFDRQMGMGANVMPMDLRDLNDGVYVFNIVADGKTITRKVTVNK